MTEEMTAGSLEYGHVVNLEDGKYLLSFVNWREDTRDCKVHLVKRENGISIDMIVPINHTFHVDKGIKVF